MRIQWVKIVNFIIYVRILRGEGEPREACATKKQRTITTEQLQIILLNKLHLYKQGVQGQMLAVASLVPRPSPCFSMLRAEKSEKAWCILLRNDDVEDAV